MVYPYNEDQNRRPYMTAMPSLREAMGPIDNFASGVRQGWNTGQSMFDAGVAGLARAVGANDTARDWEQSADEQAREAAQYANPSVQVAPWREGGGGWANAAPWLVNQAGQLVGGVAPLVAGGVAGMAAAPLIPEAVGGAALASGLGMGIASFPQAVGANYQAERDANAAQGLGEVTPEQAQSAAIWGVPSAALNAFAPTKAIGIGQTASQMASRTMLEAAKDVAKVGIDNALATGGQKAIEQSFRPDISEGNKSKDMFDSIVTGFIGGAAMGGAGEVAGRTIKAIRPDAPTQDLDAFTKSILEPEKAAQEAAIDRSASFFGGNDPLQDAAANPLRNIEGEVSFLDEGQIAPRQEISPPDVPKQYLVEAERAARDGTLDQRMAEIEGQDSPAASARRTAFDFVRRFIADERGMAKIGADETNQILMDGVKPVSDKERLDLLASKPLGRSGEQAPVGGMFDEANTAQTDMLFSGAKEERVKEPQTILGFVRAMGGLQDWKGELRAADINKRYPGTVRKEGKPLDMMREAAAEAGFLPEDSTPDDLIQAILSDKPVYSQRDMDQAYAFDAQKQTQEYERSVRNNRKELKLSYSDQPKEVIYEAASLMATGDYLPEEAIKAATEIKIQRERNLTPAVEGFAESAFSEPAEGFSSANVKERSPRQYELEARKLLDDSPDVFDAYTTELERSGDTARANTYREVQKAFVAEQEKNAITRKVGNTEAKFAPTRNGFVRLPDPPDAKQPIDRPAGTPAVAGPLGVAPPIPPLPPKNTIPPRPADIPASRPVEAAKTPLKAKIGGGGGGGDGGGEPPRGPAGDTPEPPRKPIPMEAVDGSPLRTPADIDNGLKRFLQNVDFGSAGDAARKLGLYVTTNHHHDEMYGRIMPSQLEYSREVDHRAAISQRMQADAMGGQARINFFAKNNPKLAEHTRTVERAYKLGMDPSKAWESQPQRVQKGDLYESYKNLHAEAQKSYNALKSAPGGMEMHDVMREQYQTHWMSKPAAVLFTLLNDLADLPEELRARIVDPSERLINDPKAAQGNSFVSKLMAESLENNLEVAKAYLKTNDMSESAIRDLVDDIERQKGLLKEVPYSALTRSGKYGIGFRLATDESGNISNDALQRIKASIAEAGFNNVVVEPLANQDYIFIRSDNKTQVNNLKELIKKHVKEGIVLEKDFQAGTMDAFSKSPAASKTIEKIIRQIESDDRYVAPEGSSEEMQKSLDLRKQQMISALRNIAVDFLPEASMAKYEQQRNYIPGFEADPLQSMAKQSIENAQHVANLIGTYRVNKSLAKMRAEWEAAKDPMSASNKYESIMAALYARNAGKEEARSLQIGATPFEALQSLNYSYYLGLNPSFGIIQMSQIPMYVIPELGKRYGFMKATSAIGKTAMPAMRILAAVAKEAKKVGGNAIADMPITIDALKNAGLDDETSRFMIHMVNSGGIDTGGLARSLGYIAENKINGGAYGALDTASRWSSAIGYYGETLSRIQTALMAKEVFKSDKRNDISTPEGWNKLIKETHRVLDEALFDYSNENRATGFSDDPRSLLGRSTKLAFAFQAYWMMAIEKQYRELHRLITDANPEHRKEAAKFLLGHLAATSLIAGSLGIPGMSAFQKAYEKFEDWRDPEGGPHDMREDYSTWLEHTLGRDVGDAVAYGAPRLIGQDWSKRTGEQDFAPIPTFLYDRGSWKDSFNKWALQKEGPVQGAFANIMTAIDKFNAGDTFGAATSILPAAGLRNAANTARAMSSGQYRDSRGHTIPNVEPTTGGIVSGFMGFTPTNLAREREENSMLHRYDNAIEYDARNLVMPMVDALRDGDKVAFNRMLPKAREFERMHPGHKIVERAQETFKREYKELNTAEKTGMPYQRWKDDPKRKQRAQRYVDDILNNRGY